MNYSSSLHNQSGGLIQGKIIRIFGKGGRVQPGEIRVNVNNQYPIKLLHEIRKVELDGDYAKPYPVFLVHDLKLDVAYELQWHRIGREISEMKAIAMVVR